MPGPLPKPAATRRRRNRAAGAATLYPVDPAGVTVPELPERTTAIWHPMTLSWWQDLWTSPMAAEYDTSDIHGLYLLAVLVDQFWQEPAPETAREIRLHRQCYGLTPIDRRRLQWEIERADEAQARGAKRRAAAARKTPKDDPRSALTAV